MEPYTITIIVLASLVLLSWVLLLVVLHYVRHRKLPKMVMRMKQKKDPCYRCRRARKYVCDGCYVKLRKEWYNEHPEKQTNRDS